MGRAIDRPERYRLAVERRRRGWSQVELAARAGVPRATLSALENGRSAPSVDAALALAKALGTTVERLFAPEAVDAWAAPAAPAFYAARVGGRIVGYPLEPLLAGPPIPDLLEEAPLDRTLVVATCDPLAPILAGALAERGVRLIALARSSRDALALLDAGLVHAAGIHLATREDPDRHRTAAPGRALLSVAAWDVGLAHRRAGPTTTEDLIRPEAVWVSRPIGSGARACLDRVLDAAPPARRPHDLARTARDHRAVADIVASGFAEAGVSLRLAALERGLGFLSVETALYDLAVPTELLDDPRGEALVAAIQSRPFRQALAALPGIDAERCGGLAHAN